MPNSTLTAMTSASALTGTELFYSVQGGADRKVTSSQFYTYITGVSTLGSTPAALTLTNDTNVTLTASGLSSVAVLTPINLIAGWTGTLSSSRIGIIGSSQVTGLSTGVSAIILATSNMAVYVSSGGSDLNSGSSTAPFASINFASAFLARYDYQNTFTATINVSSGTISAPTTSTLSALTNGSGSVIGAGSSLTTLFDAGGNGGFHVPRGSGWTINGFTVDTSQFAVWANGGTADIKSISVEDTGNSASAYYFSVANGGYLLCQNTTISISSNSFAGFIGTYFTPGGGGTARFRTTTVNLPSTTFGSGSAWIFGANYSGEFSVLWNTMTINNKANYLGHQIDTSGSKCYLSIDNSLSDLPGGTPIIDNALVLTALNANITAIMANNQVVPNTTIANGGFSMAQNTVNKGLYLAYNDNGKIRFAGSDTVVAEYTHAAYGGI